MDANILHRSAEGKTETHGKDHLKMFLEFQKPSVSAKQRDGVTIQFKNGDPIAINGKKSHL